MSETGQGPLRLGCRRASRQLAQVLDGWRHRAFPEPPCEAVGGLFDDLLDARQCLLALRPRLFQNGRQGVNVTQIDAGQTSNLRFDVARHGQVDDLLTLPLAQGGASRCILGTEDGLGRPGTADDEVGLGQRRRTDRPGDRDSLMAFPQRLGALDMMVGDQHSPYAVVNETADHPLPPLPSPKDQDGAVHQTGPKRLAREQHRRRGSRRGKAAYVCLRTRSLADGDGCMKKPRGYRASSRPLLCRLPASPNLTQDLRLAEHERIQAAGHAKKVTSGLYAFKDEQVSA